MTQPAHSRPRKVSRTAARGRPKWELWAVLGLSVVILAFLTSIGSCRLFTMVKELVSPGARGPISLTILHSNDTWGYIFPCG